MLRAKRSGRGDPAIFTQDQDTSCWAELWGDQVWILRKSHKTEEQMEAQRGESTCPELHSKWEGKENERYYMASSWLCSQSPCLVTWHTSCSTANALAVPRSSGFWSTDPITPHDSHAPRVPLPHSQGTGPRPRQKQQSHSLPGDSARRK